MEIISPKTYIIWFVLEGAGRKGGSSTLQIPCLAFLVIHYTGLLRHFEGQVRVYNSKYALGRNIKKSKMKGRLRGEEGKACGKGPRGQTHILQLLSEQRLKSQ